MLIVAVAAAGAERNVLVGMVTRVVDGDTIDVQLTSGPIRVRLNAIDTPERGQPWGSEATEALSELVKGKEVELEPFEQDRYERLVANVFRDGMNVNLEMVKQGHAWAFRYYMKKDDAELCIYEFAAREARRGLWGLAGGKRVAPWEWRRRKNLAAFTDYSGETIAACVAAIGREKH
jgi:endonuclease YncB( thermonuclease family)